MSQLVQNRDANLFAHARFAAVGRAVLIDAFVPAARHIEYAFAKDVHDVAQLCAID